MMPESNNPDELIPTRQSLLGRLKDWDDHESWREFFDTYWKLIYQVAIKAGLTDAEAQDVVQETVIGVLKQMPGFEYRPENGSFKSYLLTQTGWRIADQFRKRRANPLMEPRGAPTSTEGPPGQDIADPASLDWQKNWDEDWEQNLMQAAIQRVKLRVNSKAYQMFDLLVFKEWPIARVAQAFHVNQAKVYLAKHRVSRLLKEEVSRLRTDETLAAIGAQTRKHLK
jgi:RNA polymerase sigma-70 factor (ECF subfamily)